MSAPRLRCGKCERVLARLIWHGADPFAGTGLRQARRTPKAFRKAEAAGDLIDTAPLRDTYRCGCGAQPSVSPVRVIAAAARASELGCDLYTDRPAYGLPQPLS